MPPTKIIFDTDPGVDDAMALMLLARHPDAELVGITTVFGNADIHTVTRNALYLKKRLGLDCPVARGAGGAIAGAVPGPAPHFVHGRNGLGEIELPETTAETAIHSPAHEFMIDTLRGDPHEVTIVAVGRLTNLALALQRAPDIPSLVHEVVVMGGAFGRNGHLGNVSPVAEANIHGDPQAADIVFGADWPVTIVSLDVTQQTVMNDGYISDLALNGGEDGRFVRDISAFYRDFHKQSVGLNGFYVHDSSAAAYALHPDLFATERGAVRVVSGGIANGQTIIKPDGSSFPPGPWDGRPSQAICTGVDSERLLALYYDTLLA